MCMTAGNQNELGHRIPSIMLGSPLRKTERVSSFSLNLAIKVGEEQGPIIQPSVSGRVR